MRAMINYRYRCTAWYRLVRLPPFQVNGAIISKQWMIAVEDCESKTGCGFPLTGLKTGWV